MILFVMFMLTIVLTLQHPVASNPALVRQAGIGLIEINGPIAFQTTSRAFSASGATHTLSQIEKLRQDMSVKGVLVRINSPGGTVGASQEIFNALRHLKQDRNIPVFVSIGDMGASGAYYVALAADKIYANPGSLVGSIGVLIGSINFSELAEAHGVSMNLYKSGPFKDILSGWRDATDAESALLNQMVKDVHDQFVSAVTAARGLDEVVTRELAQGQIYTGRTAKSVNLVDQLGGQREALAQLAALVEIKGDPKIIRKDDVNFGSFLSLWKDQMGMQLSDLIIPRLMVTF